MREDRDLENAGFHLAGELPRYLAFLDSQRIDSVGLLERSGISPDILRTPDAPVSAQAAYDFLEEACRAAETERLGLSVAMQTNLADVSGLGEPLLKARTPWEYLLIACEVANHPVQALGFSVVQGRDGLLRVSFCRRVPPSLGSHQSDLETAALTIKRWGEAFGKEWRPTRINFAYPPRRPLDDCEVFSGAQIVNSDSISWFEFPLADSLQIFRRASRAPDAQSLGNPADAPRPESVADQAKLEILALLSSGTAKVGTVAGSLDMSARTLQRALQNSGSDFRSLVLEARIDQACAWLADTDKPVDEIAFDLGYRDPANFSRAFRRRLGVPPSGFRAAHRELDGG